MDYANVTYPEIHRDIPVVLQRIMDDLWKFRFVDARVLSERVDAAVTWVEKTYPADLLHRAPTWIRDRASNL